MHRRHATLFITLCWALCLPYAARADLRADMRDWQARFQATAQEQAAGAVILSKQSRLTVDSHNQTSFTTRIIIAVLDDQAIQDYSQFRMGFNAHYENLELVSAHLLSADGQFHDVSPDAVQIKTADEAYRFDDLRYLTFALPALKAGSIIGYETRSTQKLSAMPGQWFERVWFMKLQPATDSFRIDPLRNATLVVRTANGPIAHHLMQNSTVQPHIRHDGAHTEYTWELHNLPAIRPEAGMAPIDDQIPSVMLSSVANWRQIDAWGADTYLSRAQADGAIRQRVAALLKPGMSTLEKTKAIFYDVQKNIRYIGADLDRGGYVPHRADQILGNGYGDCKDQAVLLVTMLRAAGIDAYPALVSPYAQPQVSPDVPMLGFSHMIARVPGVAGGLWLDTSGDAGSFPGIAWQLEQRTAFVIDGKGGHLTTIPASKAQDNRVDVDVRYGFEPPDITATIDISMTGNFGNAFKLRQKHDPNIEQLLGRIVRGMHNNSTLRSLEMEGSANDDQPFIVHAVAVIPDAYTKEKQNEVKFGGDLSGLIAQYTALPEIQTIKERRSDYHIGFPYQLHQHTVVPRPGDAYRPIVPTTERDATNRWFDYGLTAQVTDASIEVDTRFTLKPRIIPLGQFAQFRESLLDTQRNSPWIALYKRDTQYQQQRELENRLAASGQDLGAQLELANHHLLTADYTQAEQVARQIIQQHPDNGEAYYLLGISLGFLDRFKDSEAALKQARKLGYTK